MTPSPDERDWARLGRCVRSRREELGLTQAEVHAAGGPSPATLYLLETGQRDSYRPRLLRGLERALGWAPESIARVLAGGDALLEHEELPGPPRPRAPLGSAAPIPPPVERVSSWAAQFRSLPLSPREKVSVLAQLLSEATAELDADAEAEGRVEGRAGDRAGAQPAVGAQARTA